MNRLTTNSISGWLAGNGNWKRKYEEEDMEGDMEGKKDEQNDGMMDRDEDLGQ